MAGRSNTKLTTIVRLPAEKTPADEGRSTLVEGGLVKTKF
jgi:hypothetical protein